jgi:ribosome-binding protein aMBF1 (putative translation factor)
MLLNLMNHQQWDPIVLTSKNPKKSETRTTVLKSSVIKQSNPVKMEKIYDPNNPDTEPITKPVMIDSEFGKQIVAARCARKLTQKELANKISIPESIIKDYEKGQGVRNGAYISKIKNFLNIHK